MVDVCVVGGGVMGLMSALNLARSGLNVCLLDRQALGREASWAGGGIVSPLYPWRYASAVTALASWSQDFYPRLASDLMVHTGIDPQVNAVGLYWLDLDDEALALSWAQSCGYALQHVDMQAAVQALPGLGAGFERALHMGGLANIRNPRLIKALRAMLLKFPNIEIRENCTVIEFINEQGRVGGVRSSQGEVRATHTVLAAGAWSGDLLKPLGFALPVQPVKGQMILYRSEPGFLPAMVLAKGRYAILRRDGHVLVGSTLEHAGYDKRPTQDALASLKASAEALLPALARSEVVGHWAGLRPGSPEFARGDFVYRGASGVPGALAELRALSQWSVAGAGILRAVEELAAGRAAGR